MMTVIESFRLISECTTKMMLIFRSTKNSNLPKTTQERETLVYDILILLKEEPPDKSLVSTILPHCRNSLMPGGNKKVTQT